MHATVACRANFCNSRIGSWCNRSSRCRDTDGGGQDSNASSIPQFIRSSRRTQIPKRPSCCPDRDKEEGFGALYRGVSLTALRQGTNQAVNFTAYTEFKQFLQKAQPQYEGKNLPAYQTTLIGLVSGAMGPFSNAPIDTIKTRLQKTPAEPGQTAISRIVNISNDMFKQEGPRAFYKGITPRVMRVAPGQAVTFTVYEFLKKKLEDSSLPFTGGNYEE